MQTDPSRIKKTDAGDPEKCSVWNLHKIFTENDTQSTIHNDCKSANIGCVDCKKILKKNISFEISPIRERFHNSSLIKIISTKLSQPVVKKHQKKQKSKLKLLEKLLDYNFF